MNIQVQGVPTSGVIDTGADNTITRGNLFKKVATADRLKKKEFMKPNHVHGRIDLKISFDEKVLHTPVYIKMDAHDQLGLQKACVASLTLLSLTKVYHHFTRQEIRHGDEGSTARITD